MVATKVVMKDVYWVVWLVAWRVEMMAGLTADLLGSLKAGHLAEMWVEWMVVQKVAH